MKGKIRLLPIIALILVSVLGLVGLYLTSHYNYLLFHSVVEVFAIVVAGGLFMVAWNTRRMVNNGYLLFIGVAYLFVAGIDLVHALAYEGMGVFPGFSANEATQLWLAARYLQSLSLLVAPWFIHRKARADLLVAGYALVTALLLASVFTGLFPTCYVAGVGLTAFKKVSEYVIALIFAASIAHLAVHRQDLDRRVWRLLVASIVMTVAAELAFTEYIGVYDVANMLGHLFKIVAFGLLYKAIVETGLVKPYRLLFRDLVQRTKELQVRNEDLNAFSRMVAHDLKNPLAAIVGYTGLVREQDGATTAEQWQEYAEVVDMSARKMERIIQELLVLASMHQGEVEAQSLDMGRIVAEVKKRMAYLVEQSRGEIIAPTNWPAVRGNSLWIEEVWANYISNALKYGGRPPRIELGATEQPGGMVRFWVRDNGAGIAAEEQPLLFRPFTQLNQVKAEGHGLGLSIVQHVVKKLGGEVGVASAPGEGSTFWFTLPR